MPIRTSMYVDGRPLDVGVENGKDVMMIINMLKPVN
jgi:hypothetical protein